MSLLENSICTAEEKSFLRGGSCFHIARCELLGLPIRPKHTGIMSQNCVILQICINGDKSIIFSTPTLALRAWGQSNKVV